jgi:hypothetical protein
VRRWRKQIRAGIIVVASFVLLVTVLPQVASSLGLGSLAGRLAGDSCGTSSVVSGSSGGSSGGSGGSSTSSSSNCSSSGSGSGSGSGSSSGSSSGNVAGTIVITGAPSGFTPGELGVGACPASSPAGQVCADPVYALATDGTYSFTLSPGSWRVDGFYEINPYGGAFLGTARIIDVAPNQLISADFTVPYSKPASLSGKVTVTDVPSGATIEETSVLLCPPGAPYLGKVQSISCVTGYGAYASSASNSYQITGLPPTTWIAYPSYCTEFSCVTNAQAGKTVTLTPGHVTTLNLTTPFIIPGDGLAAGTISITGAPKGFSTELGVTACQTLSTGSNCVQEFVNSTGTSDPYAVLLGTGVWQITGYYLAPVFGNAISGPTQVVTIKDEKTTTLNLALPYKVLGTAKGPITIIGLPHGVHPTSYSVTACPAAVTPFTYFPSLSCVTEYSGPGGSVFGAEDPTRLGRAAPKQPVHLPRSGSGLNSYSLPTLTAGQWVLTPSYETAFGTFTAHRGTTVTIAAGRTTTRPLFMIYQAPTDGVLTGTVSVVGAPAGAFLSTVRACDAAPTSLCSGEVDAQVQSDGTYQLPLPPGTWWVSGVVDVFGVGTTGSESVSPPREVTVAAGSHLIEWFTVKVS